MLEPHLLRVGIIETDAAKAQALSEALRGMGVTEITHPTAAECSSSQHNLLIVGDSNLDSLPAKTLQTPDSHPLPYLVYTSKQPPEELRDLIAAGASGIISHPIDTAKLQVTLRNFIRQKKSKELGQQMRRAEFFRKFSSEDFHMLLQVAIARQFPAGSTIIQKGDPADCFYVLLSGTVEVLITDEKKPNLHVTISAGQPLGEMSILDGSPRSAYCIAATDCNVLEIGGHILNDTDYPLRLKLFGQLAFVLAKRIRNLNQLLEGAELHAPTPEPHSPITKPQPEVCKPRKATPTEDDIPTDDDDTHSEIDELLSPSENPFSMPAGHAENYTPGVRTQEKYDVLKRKILLRNDFLFSRIPKPLCHMIANKLSGYWTGGKLAKINPHRLWPQEVFTTGTALLKRSLHLIVCCSEGDAAFSEVFLGLPLSHCVVGRSQVGCLGTFLGSDDAIKRYLNTDPPYEAVKFDMGIAADRLWRGEECIEFLTHTALDVRDETLFLVVDDTDGKNTKQVREAFPTHQIVTVVKGMTYDPELEGSFFTLTEEQLTEEGVLHQKRGKDASGFFAGETFFLPDLSHYYQGVPVLEEWGFLFGTIGTFAAMGPDHSGLTWGSSGGAEGALRAARAMYGLRGAQTAQELASAITWANE